MHTEYIFLELNESDTHRDIHVNYDSKKIERVPSHSIKAGCACLV